MTKTKEKHHSIPHECDRRLAQAVIAKIIRQSEEPKQNGLEKWLGEGEKR